MIGAGTRLQPKQHNQQHCVFACDITITESSIHHCSIQHSSNCLTRFLHPTHQAPELQSGACTHIRTEPGVLHTVCADLAGQHLHCVIHVSFWDTHRRSGGGCYSGTRCHFTGKAAGTSLYTPDQGTSLYGVPCAHVVQALPEQLNQGWGQQICSWLL